jgi:hypothetical protein
MSANLRRIIILTVVVSFGLPAGVHAQITIDTFFNTTSLLTATNDGSVFEDTPMVIDGDPSTRRVTASVGGTFSLATQVIGTGWVIDGSGPGAGSANAEAEYLGFTLNLGTNYFFEFAVNQVFNTPVLGVILQNTSQSLTLSTGVPLTPTTNGYSVFIDVRTLAGYTPAFLDGVNDISVLVGAGDQDFFVEAANIQFSPVPEPSTWALFAAAAGLTAVVARRRQG